MHITEAQAESILPAFRRAAEALAASWDAQGEMEMFLNVTCDGMTAELEMFAGAIDSDGRGEVLSTADVIAYFANLENER